MAKRKTTEGPYPEGVNDANAGRDAIMEWVYAINNTGVREAKGGHVIQMAKRSQQLNGIAEEITSLMRPMDMNPEGSVLLSAKEVHKIKGWMEQVGIIADELKGAGK